MITLKLSAYQYDKLMTLLRSTCGYHKIYSEAMVQALARDLLNTIPQAQVPDC